MNTILKNKRRALTALAFCLMTVNPVHAAVINWNTPTTISGDTDVSTTGTLLYAYNFGDPSVTSASVNGVTFAQFGVTHLSQATVTVGNVSLEIDGLHQFYTGDDIAGSASAPFANLSNAYQGLLESGVSTDNYNGSLTLTLGGLDLGQSYLVQFWSSDAGALTFNTAGTTYTAGNAVTLDNNNTDASGGVGQWVTGSFTADAATQGLTIEASVLSDLPAINAFQVRVEPVPEPGTLALLALGVATLAGCGWQRRRAGRE